MSAHVCIVIPAYNESQVIAKVIAEVQQAGYRSIVVVDDGSTDDTQAQARQAGAHAIRHKLNRGKGAAAKTGVEAAKRLGADIMVTFDGDGQHDPQDIKRLTAPIIERQCDVALGVRPRDPRHMPRHKILANVVADFFTWTMFGIMVRDSQSGFRAFSRRAAMLINPQADRYDYESEVIGQIHAWHLPFCQVPVTVRYTAYSMKKVSRQSFVNGLKTLYRMLWNLAA
jgi:glycosyltransferase involved in cell wall biosynthesis